MSTFYLLNFLKTLTSHIYNLNVCNDYIVLIQFILFPYRSISLPCVNFGYVLLDIFYRVVILFSQVIPFLLVLPISLIGFIPFSSCQLCVRVSWVNGWLCKKERKKKKQKNKHIRERKLFYRKLKLSAEHCQQNNVCSLT